MQLKVKFIGVLILVDMVYTLGVKETCAAFNAVNDIALFQQEFS